MTQGLRGASGKTLSFFSRSDYTLSILDADATLDRLGIAQAI
jgi:hypothetical protein